MLIQIIPIYSSYDYLGVQEPTSLIGYFIGTPESGARAGFYADASIYGVQSTGPALFIGFMSDEADSRSGFVLQYSVGKLYIGV